MEKLELKDIVMKLVGKVNPVGETITDESRLEALKDLCNLVDDLVAEINSVVICNRYSYESSRKIAADYAYKFLIENLGIKE